MREFRRCLASGELEAAADAGHGELLDRFHGDWALRARDEHAAELAGVLGALTARPEDAGDLPSGSPRWTARGSSRATRPPRRRGGAVGVALIDAETGATEDARRLVSELARDGGSALAMDANWHGACILPDAAVHVADREAGAAL